MSENPDAQKLLEGAYSLDTPEDNIEYYQNFASIYDTQYAQTLGYFYPQALARVFHEQSQGRDVPVADIGCGTGLVAQALGLQKSEIDGIDISAEMLNAAKDKSVYRELYEIDLTRSLAGLPGNYGAVLSAGTFTFGHLGPEPLLDLLKIARSGALFCIGVNSAHYKKAHFKKVLDVMAASNLIGTPELREVPVYSRSGHEHSGDQASILIYRKT